MERGVLILTPFFSPNVGGVETHLTDLCDTLRKRNYFVYVLTYQPLSVSIKAKKVETADNLYIRRLWWPGYNLFNKFESFPKIFNFFYLTLGLSFLSFLFMLKNKNNIKVVHAQGIAAAFIAIILKYIFHKPVVISTHAIYEFKRETLFPKIVKEIFNKADKVLALAEGSRRELIKIGIKKEKIGIYTYWVNQKIFKLFDKDKAREETGLKGKFIVFYAGRLIEIKGARTIIKVARELINFKNILFVFVGTGPLEKELEQVAKETDNIVFPGRIENQKLPYYYNSADVFVIPSNYAEGFARVVLEALSCGTPVVASNMGVIPEEINKNVGILIKPTGKNFKEKILLLYKNHNLLNRLSKQAVIFAREKYSEKNINKIIASYEGVSHNIKK